MLTQNTPPLGRTRVCEQDFKVNGHNFKDNSQTVTITQCTSPMLCPEDMKELSFIVSEQWSEDCVDNNYNDKVKC